MNILNGNEILKSERIKAKQNFERLERELEKAAVENIIKKENDPDKDNPNKYTIEYRRRLYLELEEDKIKKEEEKKQKSKSIYEMDDLPKLPPSVYKENGEIRICNQGKYVFYINEDIYDKGIMLFELHLPKFMDTSHVKINLNPQYIRVDAKGKITQLRFEHEVIVEECKIQRSTTTGHLVVQAPIYGFKPKQKIIYEEPKKKD